VWLSWDHCVWWLSPFGRSFVMKSERSKLVRWSSDGGSASLAYRVVFLHESATVF
jgi:hypothetical protein